MSLLKKKNQLAPMATTATTATMTQVKGLFVVVVAADVAEATLGAGWCRRCLRRISLAWLVACSLQGGAACSAEFVPALIFEPHRGQKFDSHGVSLAVGEETRILVFDFRKA